MPPRCESGILYGTSRYGKELRLRRFAKLLLVVAAFGVGAAAPAWAQSSPPSGKRAAVFELVHQIKTATDQVAPKASYGSGFVVGVDGLLATNYHVVSAALHESRRYKLFMVEGEESVPASVVAIDVVNDLALVRVQRTFPHAIGFAATEPRVGAKIFSMGWPEDLNKSVIEGNFNGVVAEGPYRKVQMSIPLNPGMSGGPTINRDGELLGVNVSIQLDSQSIAFAVPATVLQELMARPTANLMDEEAFHAEVKRQLEDVQERLAKLVLEGRREPVHVPGWVAERSQGLLKCWRESGSGVKELSSRTTETCYLPNAANVRSDIDSGTFRFRYEVMQSTRLNSWQFLNLVNGAMRSAPFLFTDYLENFTTKFRCDELDLVNVYKVPLRVHYCLNAYVRYPGLYNVEAEAVTLVTGRPAFLVSATYAGFTEDRANALLMNLLDSIRPEGP